MQCATRGCEYPIQHSMSLVAELVQALQLVLARNEYLENKVKMLEEEVDSLKDTFLEDHIIQYPCSDLPAVLIDDAADADARSSGSSRTIEQFLIQESQTLVREEDENGFSFFVPAPSEFTETVTAESSDASEGNPSDVNLSTA